MLSAVILARHLDTSSFAAYSYFQMTVSMLGTYASVGLGATSSRYFSEIGCEEFGQPRPPLGILVQSSVIMAVIAFVAVSAIPAGWLSAGLAVPQILVALGVAALVLGAVPAGAIIGLEEYRAAALISALTGGIVLFAGWLAVHYQMELVAMTAIIVSSMTQAIGQYIVAIRAVGQNVFAINRRPARADLRRVFGFAGPMFIVSMLSAAGPWLVGISILRGNTGEHGFALYAIGLQWYSLALLVPGMISRVILPRLVKGAQEEGTFGLLKQGTALSVIVAIVFFVLVLGFSSWVVGWYGAEYQDEGRWLIVAFMAAGIIAAPVDTIGSAILARDGQLAWLAVTGCWLMVLLVTVSWTSILNVWAAVIALVAASSAQLALAVAFALRRGLL